MDSNSHLQTLPSQELAVFSKHFKSSAALPCLCVQGNVALLQGARGKQGFLELHCTNSAVSEISIINTPMTLTPVETINIKSEGNFPATATPADATITTSA